MDANQVFATGGVSGLTGLILFLVYRFLFTRHSIRSNCCGKTIAIETSGDETPKKTNPIVELRNVEVRTECPTDESKQRTTDA